MSGQGFSMFNPALQRFLGATVINMIGSAALFGFVLIYFHEIRGIPTAQAGLAVGAMSFTMVVLTPYAGSLSDRFGARRMLTAGCLVSIVAGVSYVWVHSFVSAVAVSVLLGLGNALWFPAQSALMSLIVSPQERPTLMAWQRASMNLGAALGGVVGGFLVRTGSVTSYYWLFGLNVATYLVFLVILPGMPSGRVERPEHAERHGFREVFADRFYVRLLVTDLSIALGFGFLWSFMPAYASALGIGKRTIGLLFMFGAATVVLTQIATLGWVRGGERMRWLAIMNLWFVGAFILMNVTPHVGIWVAVGLIAVGQVMGGFGEAILGAVRMPLTADLAPPTLIGRYYGLSTMVFQACMGLANTIGGATMGVSL
ncbi:MAG: MFS transporter, partial [Ilumatobacter sp.]|nr:MFS transporter [Ilumatobacter sp.]